MNPLDETERPVTYQITLPGELGDGLVRGLHGAAQTAEVWDRNPQVTILRVQVQDQAALRGLLNQLWDLNLTLIDVRRMCPKKERDDHD